MTLISGFKPFSSLPSGPAISSQPRFGSAEGPSNDTFTPPASAVFNPDTKTLEIYGRLDELPASAWQAKDITLKPGAVFEGDLVHKNGNIQVESGARVTGSIEAGDEHHVYVLGKVGNITGGKFVVIYKSAEAGDIKAGEVQVSGKADNILEGRRVTVFEGGETGNISATVVMTKENTQVGDIHPIYDATIGGKAGNIFITNKFILSSKALEDHYPNDNRLLISRNAVVGNIESSRFSLIESMSIDGKAGNITSFGTVFVSENAEAGDIQTKGFVYVSGKAGNVSTKEDIQVFQNAEVGDLQVGSKAEISGKTGGITMTGNKAEVLLRDNAVVTGDITMPGTKAHVLIEDNAIIKGNIHFQEPTSFWRSWARPKRQVILKQNTHPIDAGRIHGQKVQILTYDQWQGKR